MNNHNDEDEYDYLDYRDPYCMHGIYEDDYCEKCVKAEEAYERYKQQQDFNYWHPVDDES